MTPSAREPSATARGVPPLRAIRSESVNSSAGDFSPMLPNELYNGVGRALAKLRPVNVHSAHPRMGRERYEIAPRISLTSLPRRLYFSLSQDHDRAAFGSFVRQTCQLGRVRKLPFGHSGNREKCYRLAVPEGDRACLVQKQRVDVARSLHGLAAHGQNVVLHDAVHSGDADGGQQAPMVVGIRQTSSETSTATEGTPPVPRLTL